MSTPAEIISVYSEKEILSVDLKVRDEASIDFSE